MTAETDGDPQRPSDAVGRRVAIVVALVFGAVATVGWCGAAYLLATDSGPNDGIAAFLFMGWLMTSGVIALGLAALSGPIRGVSRKRRGSGAIAVIDPDRLQAQAFAGDSAEWSGEASVPFDAPAPRWFMLASGVAFLAVDVWLYAAGRIGIGGLFFAGIGGLFLIYWAWLAFQDASTERPLPGDAAYVRQAGRRDGPPVS